MEEIRYEIAGDNSGHEYYIPVDKSDHWYEWLELPDDDPLSWEEPDYAVRIDGGFSFTNPRCT